MLYDKAMKAFYKLKQLNPRQNALLALKLFDSLIYPIISYAGVVWGPTYMNKLTPTNFKKLTENVIVEKINIKLCKYVLGVNKFAANDAVRGELGRFPLLINILNQSINYKKRINAMSSETLVKKSCLEAINSHPNFKIQWTHIADNLFEYFDTGHSSVLQQLKNEYCKMWHQEINPQYSYGKLRTYCTFKKQFHMENYLAQLPLNKRQNLTKLRISAHRLAIETGRYTRPITPISERVCTLCNSGDIEDEPHLVLKCNFFKEQRTKLQNDIHNFSSLKLEPTEHIFQLIMSCCNGDLEYAISVCTFINECFEIRDNYLNAH